MIEKIEDSRRRPLLVIDRDMNLRAANNTIKAWEDQVGLSVDLRPVGVVSDGEEQ